MDHKRISKADPDRDVSKRHQALDDAAIHQNLFPSAAFSEIRTDRKASCACGGGCPACRSGHDGLNISLPNDPAEIDADRMADRVMRMSSDEITNSGRDTGAKGTIHRKCDACEEDKEQTIQRFAFPADRDAPTPVDAHVGEALAMGGHQLERSTRDFFEPRFGYDLSSIRIHTGPTAARSASAVEAKAYTLGSDIVFGDGEYSHTSETGLHLLAHELAHVVQNGTPGSEPPRTIKRQPKGETKPKIKAGPASSSPSLKLMPSINGEPCACLVAIHTDERGARVIAKLLHANCAYNLALVMPDTGNRPIDIPNVGQKDPNELFPQDVVEQCMTDEAACRDRLKADAASTDRNTTLKYAQTQFFLAVKDCSNSFTLPVIGLHDNRTSDTTNYLDLVAKKKINVDKLKVDVDKTKPKEKGKPDPGKKAIDDLRKDLKGAGGILDAEKTTNIFRWCALPDIGKCHIGDPEHPDNVVWVTNEEDFKKLAATNVNVAFQTKAGPESKTDLSTVFLHLRTLAQMQQLGDFFEGFLTGEFLLDLLLGGDDPDNIDPDKLRFINIEGSGLSHDKQSASERVRNYDAVIDVLKTVPDAYCCGDKPSGVEEGIRKDLEMSEADIDKKLLEQSLSRLVEAIKNLNPL